MKVPLNFKGMKLVKCYDSYALYKNRYYRECFSYYELGNIPKEVKRVRNINYEKNRYF